MDDWREVAARQHGVIARGAAGLTRRVAEGEVRRGTLIPYGRRTLVTAAGAATPERVLWLAVTEAGPDAVLSGAGALWLYGVPVAAPSAPEVLVPRRLRYRHAGARRVVSRELVRSRTVRGLPVASVPVAVRRAGGELAPDELASVVEHVLRLRLTTREQLRRALGHGLVGAAALRSALAVTDAESHSLWERRLAAMLRRAGLPRPRRQARIGSEPAYWVDFLFERWGLAVEVDGFAVHAQPETFRYGLRRSRRLRVRHGLDVLAYAPVEIRHDGAAVVAEIAEALAVRGCAAGRGYLRQIS
jgi:very-short-patch-repair endonuclease